MIREGDVAELVRSLQRAKAEAIELGGPLARALFFTGAGCSRSAGIPLASEIAQSLVPKLAETYSLGSGLSPDDAILRLQAAGYFVGAVIDGKTDWYAVYDECFSHHYKTPDHARSIFKRAIANSFKGINWSHLCLGELVAQAYCSTVITTNFDLLALEGITAAGVIPVVCDGLESLGRINGSPDQPQLLQLNGSIHSYRLRNRPDEIDEFSEHSIATACFRDLVRNTDVIVFVGYAGREAAIMRLLDAALSEFYEKEVYWCLHGPSSLALTPESQKLMEGNPNARVLLNQDADQFFFDLCRGLGVGAPSFIRNPIKSMAKRADRIAVPEGSGLAAEIREEIERFKERLSQLEARDGSPVEDDPVNRLDRARDERFKGDDRTALNTLEPILGDDQNSPQVLSYGSFLSLRVAGQSNDPADLERAVALSKRAYEATPESDIEGRIDAGIRYANALELRGTGKSDLGDLMAALSLLEDVEKKLSNNTDQRWGDVNDNIGVIHSKIADITDSEESIKSAIASFDKVISSLNKEEGSGRWAKSVANKAVAKFTLGEFVGDPSVIQEAISLHRQAIDVLSKEASPYQWAVQHRCLSSCYAVLSDINDDVAAAEEAVRLFEEAATADVVYPPASLAGHGLNYGSILVRLGERKSNLDLVTRGIALIEEARARFELLGMDWQVENAGRAFARCEGIRVRMEKVEEGSPGDEA